MQLSLIAKAKVLFKTSKAKYFIFGEKKNIFGLQTNALFGCPDTTDVTHLYGF